MKQPFDPHDRDRLLDTFAAELTEAAYAVALRHETPGSWLELELDLWKALGETVQKWRQPLPRAVARPLAAAARVRDRAAQRRFSAVSVSGE